MFKAGEPPELTLEMPIFLRFVAAVELAIPAHLALVKGVSSLPHQVEAKNMLPFVLEAVIARKAKKSWPEVIVVAGWLDSVLVEAPAIHSVLSIIFTVASVSKSIVVSASERSKVTYQPVVLLVLTLTVEVANLGVSGVRAGNWSVSTIRVMEAAAGVNGEPVKVTPAS